MEEAVIIRVNTTGTCELCERGDEDLFAIVLGNKKIHLVCAACARVLSEWFNIPIKGEQ